MYNVGLMNSASGVPCTLNNNKENCPPLYAQGLFVQGFGDAYFTKHFKWLLRCDPQFSSDSYGQTTRLYPERVYLMMRDFHLLKKNDGWKELSEFAPFLKAVSSIPDLGDKILVDKNEVLYRCTGLLFQALQ